MHSIIIKWRLGTFPGGKPVFTCSPELLVDTSSELDLWLSPLQCPSSLVDREDLLLLLPTLLQVVDEEDTVVAFVVICVAECCVTGCCVVVDDVTVVVVILAMVFTTEDDCSVLETVEVLLEEDDTKFPSPAKEEEADGGGGACSLAMRACLALDGSSVGCCTLVVTASSPIELLCSTSGVSSTLMLVNDKQSSFVKLLDETACEP